MNPETATDAAGLREQLAGDVFEPGQDGWDLARQAFNLAIPQDPELVVAPANADDVAAVIRFAREQGLRVAPQRTGHNAGALGSLENTILLKTEKLHEVEIDPESGRARVGAGAKWEHVVPKASELGFAALHGSTPDTGVVGYTLGGGMGWYGRKHGLAVNRVLAIELVTADGELLRVDEDNHPDLFWALRGGGGNFGVVTAIEFTLHPQEQVYAGTLFFAPERAGEVFKAWNQWLKDIPEEITSVAKVMNFPPLDVIPEPVRGKSFALIQAVFLGSEEEGAKLLEPLRALGPEMDTFASVPPVGIAELAMDPPDPVPYFSGAALVGDLSDEAIDEFVAMAAPGSPLLLAELRHLEGEMGRSSGEYGCTDMLPGKFSAFGVGMVMGPEMGAALKAHLGKLHDVLAPHQVGSYCNFIEEPVDVTGFYNEQALERLRKVKAQYDADNVIRANHEVEAAA